MRATGLSEDEPSEVHRRVEALAEETIFATHPPAEERIDRLQSMTV